MKRQIGIWSFGFYLLFGFWNLTFSNTCIDENIN